MLLGTSDVRDSSEGLGGHVRLPRGVCCRPQYRGALGLDCLKCGNGQGGGVGDPGLPPGPGPAVSRPAAACPARVSVPLAVCHHAPRPCGLPPPGAQVSFLTWQRKSWSPCHAWEAHGAPARGRLPRLGRGVGHTRGARTGGCPQVPTGQDQSGSRPVWPRIRPVSCRPGAGASLRAGPKPWGGGGEVRRWRGRPACHPGPLVTWRFPWFCAP